MKDIAEAINIASDKKHWRNIFRLQEDVTTPRSSRPTQLRTSWWWWIAAKERSFKCIL